MNLPEQHREWKYLSLTIRKDNPVVICRTDISGEPVPRVIKTGLVYLIPDNEDKGIQVNFNYGPGWKILSGCALEHTRYSELKKTVDRLKQELISDSLEGLVKKTFDVFENGKPLVIFNGNEEFLLLSFGRTFDPNSTRKLQLGYSGGLKVYGYDETLALPDDVKLPAATEVVNAFRSMYDTIINKYSRDKERRHRNCSRNRRRRKGN